MVGWWSRNHVCGRVTDHTRSQSCMIGTIVVAEHSPLLPSSLPLLCGTVLQAPINFEMPLVQLKMRLSLWSGGGGQSVGIEDVVLPPQVRRALLALKPGTPLRLNWNDVRSVRSQVPCHGIPTGLMTRKIPHNNVQECAAIHSCT